MRALVAVILQLLQTTIDSVALVPCLIDKKGIKSSEQDRNDWAEHKLLHAQHLGPLDIVNFALDDPKIWNRIGVFCSVERGDAQQQKIIQMSQ